MVKAQAKTIEGWNTYEVEWVFILKNNEVNIKQNYYGCKNKRTRSAKAPV